MPLHRHAGVDLMVSIEPLETDGQIKVTLDAERLAELPEIECTVPGIFHSAPLSLRIKYSVPRYPRMYRTPCNSLEKWELA